MKIPSFGATIRPYYPPEEGIILIGLGTIINAGAIVVGGLLGLLLKNALPQRISDTLTKAIGICVLFIGLSGALQNMFTIEDGALSVGGTMMTIFSFIGGSILGGALDLEGRLERFGVWLRKRAGADGDSGFLNAFLTASLTVCIGAMAVVGAINDGLFGDISLLVTKSILDAIIIMVMAATMGKGCIFSAIPVALFQGLVTLFARFLQPVMTAQATSNLALTGSILVFCVGVNLIWDQAAPQGRQYAAHADLRRCAGLCTLKTRIPTRKPLNCPPLIRYSISYCLTSGGQFISGGDFPVFRPALLRNTG